MFDYLIFLFASSVSYFEGFFIFGNKAVLPLFISTISQLTVFLYLIGCVFVLNGFLLFKYTKFFMFLCAIFWAGTVKFYLNSNQLKSNAV